MAMIDEYLLRLLERVSEEKTGQDAVEWAIVMGHVNLTPHLDLEEDLRRIMGPDGANYSRIIEAYQTHRRHEQYHDWLETLHAQAA